MCGGLVDPHSGLLRKPPLPRPTGERKAGTTARRLSSTPRSGGEVASRRRDGVGVHAREAICDCPCRERGGLPAHFIVATPCFRSLAFSKNAARHGSRSREAGHGTQASHNLVTWPGFPRPADVLALAEDGAVALGLRQGPDLGVHHPVAHRLATSPAPPPSPSIRFMTRVPARAMGEVSLRRDRR